MLAFKFVKRSVLAAVIIATNFSPTVSQAESFETISMSESSLKVKAGEIQAYLDPKGCVPGFEAACSPVIQRSEYVSTTAHRHGDRVIYSWQILVPKSFTYKSTGAYLRAGRFLVGGQESIFNFLLDRETGYDADRKICFGPEGFGKWHNIEVRVVWDATRKKTLSEKTPGELRVVCDGVEVLSHSGRPTLGAEDKVRIALGLAGSAQSANAMNTHISIRNIKIETW
jgi:hypothetical protein